MFRFDVHMISYSYFVALTCFPSVLFTGPLCAVVGCLGVHASSPDLFMNSQLDAEIVNFPQDTIQE